MMRSYMLRGRKPRRFTVNLLSCRTTSAGAVAPHREVDLFEEYESPCKHIPLLLSPQLHCCFRARLDLLGTTKTPISVMADTTVTKGYFRVCGKEFPNISWWNQPHLRNTYLLLFFVVLTSVCDSYSAFKLLGQLS